MTKSNLSKELEQLVEIDLKSKELFFHFQNQKKQLKTKLLKTLIDYFNNNFPNSYFLKPQGNTVLIFLETDKTNPIFKVELIKDNLSFNISSFQGSNSTDIENYLNKIKIFNFFIENKSNLLKILNQIELEGLNKLNDDYSQFNSFILKFSTAITQLRTNSTKYFKDLILSKSPLSFSETDNIGIIEISNNFIQEIQLIEFNDERFIFNIKSNNIVYTTDTTDLDSFIETTFIPNLFQLLKVTPRSGTRRIKYSLMYGNANSTVFYE